MKGFTTVVAVTLAGLLGACSTATTTPATSTIDTSKSTAVTPKAGGSSTATGNAQPNLRASTMTPPSVLPVERSVYFAFDDATIAQDYVSIIEKHGKYLMASPLVKVKIEGNADERGSAEYNLALGQKRAEATMKALRLWGVRPSQMEATSWGEERPRAKGDDEKAYSQNRRADIVYSTP